MPVRGDPALARPVASLGAVSSALIFGSCMWHDCAHRQCPRKANVSQWAVPSARRFGSQIRSSRQADGTIYRSNPRPEMLYRGNVGRSRHACELWNTSGKHARTRDTFRSALFWGKFIGRTPCARLAVAYVRARRSPAPLPGLRRCALSTLASCAACSEYRTASSTNDRPPSLRASATSTALQCRENEVGPLGWPCEPMPPSSILELAEGSDHPGGQLELTAGIDR